MIEHRNRPQYFCSIGGAEDNNGGTVRQHARVQTVLKPNLMALTKSS
jgi:hypothetical protein